MRIDFEFSGGYANLRYGYHANTDELPEDVARELLSLVESSGIFKIQQSEVAPTSAGPPDVFFYRLSLYDAKRRISLFEKTCNGTGWKRAIVTGMTPIIIEF